jgi:hypothetical protein
LALRALLTLPVLPRRPQQTASWRFLTTATATPEDTIRTGTMVGPITVALASTPLLETVSITDFATAASTAEFTITASPAAYTLAAYTLVASTVAEAAIDDRATS